MDQLRSDENLRQGSKGDSTVVQPCNDGIDSIISEGMALASKGNAEQAAEEMAKVLGGQENMLASLGDYARACQKKGQHKRAIDIFSFLLQLNPNDHILCNAIGLSCLASKNLCEARSYLERAVELAPKDPLHLLNLGTLDLMQGDRAAAQNKLQTALLYATGPVRAGIEKMIRRCQTDAASSPAPPVSKPPSPNEGTEYVADSSSTPIMAKDNGTLQKDEVANFNALATQHLANSRLEEAKECLVASLALEDNQPQIRDLLLDTLRSLLAYNSKHTSRNASPQTPKFFDAKIELNPRRNGFLKYVPEELVTEKTGLNILFLSDFEIAGNQIRLMRALNRHTTHKARNAILVRDYLNFGEDLVLDSDQALREAQDLIKQADFLHFVRGIPPVKGIDWQSFLTPRNCLVDYFGGDIKFNKKTVTDFHRRSGIVGLNKYDYGMYKDAEFLMYHLPTMFDSDAYRECPVDLNFFDKEQVVIGHAPTDPWKKCTQYILPVIERVNRKVKQDIKVDLIMGVSNAEAMERKARCDIFIDLVRPKDNQLSGCPGQNSHESLALGKVTICSLDNFFLSFYPDAPIFSASIETLEELLLYILRERQAVEKKMAGAKEWLAQFSTINILRRYLHFYQYVISGNQFANSSDRFFMEF